MERPVGSLPIDVSFAVFPGNRLQVNWVSFPGPSEDNLGRAYWGATDRDSLGCCEQLISLSGQHLARVSVVHRPRKTSEYFNALSSTADGENWQPGASDARGEFHETKFEEEGVARTFATTWVEGGSFQAHYRIQEPRDDAPRDHYIEFDASGRFVAFGYEEQQDDGTMLLCRSHDGSVWVTEDRMSRITEADHVGEVRGWVVGFEEDDFAQPQSAHVYAGRWDQGFCAGRWAGFNVARLGQSGCTRHVWCDPAAGQVGTVQAAANGKTISAVPGAVSRPDDDHFVKYVGISSGDEAIIPKLVRVRALKLGRRTYVVQHDLAHKARPVYVVAFDSRAFPTGEALYLDAQDGGRAFRSLDFGSKWKPAPMDLPVCQAIQP